MNTETKNCQNCKQDFKIEPEDFEFYAKIKVPPPTFCPDCRAQRRMAWRNERSLYKRKDTFGNDIVSIYSPDKPFIVYQRDYWWSDAWDPIQYGRDYDLSKPFFQQFRELLEAVPVSGVFSSNVSNSPYVNHVGGLKDCYLTFASWECENVYYAHKSGFSKDSFDIALTDRSELCYWTVDCEQSSRLFFSGECTGCSDSVFLLDCKNCQYCFGCVGLRNKQYYIFNKPYSQKEYEEKIRELDISSFKNFQKIQEMFLQFRLKYPRKFARLVNTQNVTGDHMRGARNCFMCFDMREDLENLKYSTHGGFGTKDSYDGYGIGICELLYEGIDSGVGGSSQSKFSVVVYSSNNTDYCFNITGSSDMFGCIGLRKKQYCILNKQYTKEDYEKLRQQIIEHMHTMPYEDKQGRVYRYGEFFPTEISPFAYNETIAQEYFPLTKESVVERGYIWRDDDVKDWNITVDAKDLPDHIKKTQDSVTGERIGCLTCKKAYRVLPEELDFLRKQALPLPRQCPDCRHRARFESRNPISLWLRRCTCVGLVSENGVYRNTVEHFHKGAICPNEFETSYAPDRPEIVYCESCYNAEVV